jgi:hypothetical protein
MLAQVQIEALPFTRRVSDTSGIQYQQTHVRETRDIVKTVEPVIAGTIGQ